MKLPDLPDLEVEGLDEKYRPFWNAIKTAIRYGCRLRFVKES